jgi:acetyl-CoA carboxylase biotin carboxylase subunit
MFKKVLIANRGEIAVRILRACRDLQISPVAVYSEADRSALHVMLADEAYLIGPAPANESYLKIDTIIETALRSGCEAIHPGYGFLAENPHFAKACADAGMTFIGPSEYSISLMGDKLASRKAVEEAGVPVIPGSKGALESSRDLERLAQSIGFPILLKASAGGGGKGMRIIRNGEEIPSAFSSASGEAASAFGNPTVYAERYIEKPRHIEVQVFGDRFGNLVYLGERECSIQRRHQKLIEECPSPIVDPAFRAEIGEAAVRVARIAQYENAGTVEFLVDDSDSTLRYYFLEMNTRLQVEHPVTEIVTGRDLVVEQFRVAGGLPMSFNQSEIDLDGAAIECRIYAEDPDQNFMPSPGKITAYYEPSGPGIRNDSGVYAGFQIPLEYDPLVSKLITYGRSRKEAIFRMRRALKEFRIGGVKTSIPFFIRLLEDSEFIVGNLHTHFIEQQGLIDAERNPDPEAIEISMIGAAVNQALRKSLIKRESPRKSGWKEYGRKFWQ